MSARGANRGRALLRINRPISNILRATRVALWGESAPVSLRAGHPFNPDPDFKHAEEDVPRYPPFDKGLPAISVDALIKSQQTLFDRISAAQLPYVEQAVRNLAGYVHLLPATSSDFFCGAGGLYRLCLEIGFHSYVSSQGSVFTARDPAERRRELEAKWQLASFLAGLCCELSRAIVTSVVTNDHGEQWLPFEPITVWLKRTNSKRYFLRPPKAAVVVMHDTAHLSGVLVNAIIPPEALQHITTDDRSILMAMLSSISRITDTYSAGPFPKNVRHVRDLVIQRDQLSNPLTFGKPLVGVHVEPYLINGMRHLVKNGQWKINQKLARVHVGPEGAFCFWTTGVQEVLTMLREEGAVGLPSDPRTLGELLMASGVFEPNEEGGLWWYIKTPLSPTAYEVVKLSSVALILEDEALAVVDVYPENIVVSPAAAKAALGVVAGESVATQSTGEPSVAADYSKTLALSATGAGAGDPVRPASPRPGPAPIKTKSPPKPPASQDPKPARPREPAQVPSQAPTTAAIQAGAVDAVAAALKRPSLVNDMRRMVDAFNNDEASPMFWTAAGLAIPIGFFNATVDSVPMTGALTEAGCLSIAPGETMKVRLIKRGDAEVRCLVIQSQRALEFGFNPAGAPEDEGSIPTMES